MPMFLKMFFSGFAGSLGDLLCWGTIQSFSILLRGF